MKILHIIGQLRTGGAENVAMNILRYSNSEIIQNDFLVFGDEVGNYEQEAIELGATIHRIAKPKDSYVKFCRRLKEVVTQNKYDIVHTHTLLNNGLVAYTLKDKQNVKVISHAHSTASGKFNETLYYKIYKRLMKKYINNYCDVKIACGYDAGTYLYESEDFVIVNNGIDLDRYSYREGYRNKIRKELDIESGTFVVGHVGRLEKVKNHKYLFYLFSKILKDNSESVLLVIGTGSLISELRELAQSLCIEKNVFFLGDRSDVNEIYSAMDILVFPSLHEGIPLTLIEAQASNLPCIISDTVSFQSKINNDTNVSFVDLEKSDDWLNRIQEVKDSSRIRESNLEAFKSSGFDIKNEIKKLEKIYFELS